VTHSKDGIFETSERVRAIIGNVKSIVVLEKETFEAILDLIRIEASVKLILKDYYDDRSVSLVKV